MSAVLLLNCPDRPGVVAATAEFIAGHDGNILHAEQHVDRDEGTDDAVFFQRVEFALDGFGLDRDGIAPAFAPVADRFAMRVQLRFTDQRMPTALMASRQPHCLYDMLSRWRSGELPMDLRVVVSNHPDHADICGHLGVPFAHLPVTPETKPDQERQVLAALAAHDVELVVLARYMQILTEDFCAAYPRRIINIHHSFLPAFAGARPYHQAHERGVKVIGATAHYVTADLDSGPIIAQGVSPVSHRDSVTDLVQTGADLEKTVLARAVRLHLDNRVLTYGNRTVIFD